MVMVDCGVWVERLVVDRDEEGAETADRTITLSSRSVVALGRPLPS